MAEMSNAISVAIRGLGSEHYEFFKDILTRAFEKDPAMGERYRQVELDYDAAVHTSERRPLPNFVSGELPDGVFTLTAAIEQIAKNKRPLWLNRAKHLATETKFTFNWFLIKGRWCRCVTIGVLSAAFDKYYPNDTV